jgi:hypothetical protein
VKTARIVLCRVIRVPRFAGQRHRVSSRRETRGSQRSGTIVSSDIDEAKPPDLLIRRRSDKRVASANESRFLLITDPGSDFKQKSPFVVQKLLKIRIDERMLIESSTC